MFSDYCLLVHTPCMIKIFKYLQISEYLAHSSGAGEFGFRAYGEVLTTPILDTGMVQEYNNLTLEELTYSMLLDTS